MANTKLITNFFRLHNIRQFVESINEPANTIYYVFGGKPGQYTLGDNIVDPPSLSVESLITKTYDEMVFAKQITQNDIKIMTHKYVWTAGTVYDMYDSQDSNLEKKQFFVVSPEGGTYYVYKCLYNNGGAPVSSQPLFSATGADDIFYETADGYIWKYMYKVDSTTYNKFVTELYMPIVVDANVTSNAIAGTIDVIKLEKPGQFYNNYLSGSFTSVDTKYGGNPLKYRITAPAASNIEDFYTGCIIKIISGTGIGQYRTILGYTFSQGFKFIFVDKPFTTVPTSSTFEISPQIKLYGDGRQTVNAVARALINSSSSNSIYKIDILDRGKNYFLASANAYATDVVRTSNSVNDAILRPIISPRGGHGYDVEAELYASHMGISVKFSNTENSTISTDNDFRTIGILKDPKFADIRLTHGTLYGSGFVDTEEVVQLDLTRLSGSVGVSSTSKNIVGLGTLTNIVVNSAGNTTYANSDLIYISNVAVNAICNLTTNTIGYIDSVSIVSAGFGFSDPDSALLFMVDSNLKNIRHVNSKIITSYTISANGLSYTNADYIEISGPGVSINATANITTNTSGGITGITFTNSGKGYSPNEIAYIAITANGTGYDSVANNNLAFSGGGGTGAIATFTNSATGAISSITLINRGTGYTSAPSIVIGDGTSGTPATLTVALQANSITIKIANSIGGYSNGAKILASPVTDAGADGLYSNSDVLIFKSQLTNGDAIANVITSATGNLTTVNVNAGNNFGFTMQGLVNTYVANSTGGYLRYLGSNIVSTITVSNSAPLYAVNNVSITSGGTNYDSTKILRVDINNGGIGYDSTANNILLFTGGSGSGANATFVNNSLGKIISITMTSNGTGYVSAPTVSVSPNANGIGANLSAILANSITFTSTTGGYGAIAYFANDGAGTITSITVANSGFNYTTAPAATVSDPIGTSAILTAVLKGGADNFSNSDIINVTNGAINSTASLVSNSSGFISSIDVTNSGKQFDSATLFVKVTNSSSGNIRYFNGTTIKNIVVNDGGYPGFCSTNDILTVTGGSINATANIVSNTTGGLTTVNITNSGKGFTNHSSIAMSLVNSIGKDIRYFNSNIVSSYAINDGGSNYNNTDYIVITSNNGINATANIVTSTTGSITSLNFSNRGKNIVPWYISDISIISGGTGYSNTDVISFCGGGGSGANALLLTNSSGGIVRAYIVDGGINYNCAPTIEIANSSGGTSGGSSANLIASIAKPSRLRIYNANNISSSGQFADISFIVSASPTLVANIVYAPTTTINLKKAATVEPTIIDSANIVAKSIQAPNVSINLTGQLTSFSSSLGAGDYIYITTVDNQSDLLQVNSVTNSTHIVVTNFPAFSTNGAAISSANVRSSGNVKEKGSGYINVTNVTGFFTQSNIVYGLSSKSSSNVTLITYNGISKLPTTINQLFYYSIANPPVGMFEEDETLYTQYATAKYHSGNSTSIFVTSQNGNFLPGDTITGNSSGATCVLSSGSSYKYEGDFLRGSGDIIYIENIEPISRSNSQSETIKLIVEF